MVKISYKPVEELVILEMVEYDLRELAETCALLIDSGRPTILTWAEGVAFYHQPLPFNTQELLKERSNRRYKAEFPGGGALYMPACRRMCPALRLGRGTSRCWPPRISC